MSKMKAVNIEWDIDSGDNIVLPTEIEIPEYIIDEDEISDYLSDLTGFCHRGFELTGVLEKKNRGLAPVLCNAGSNPIHHHYFGCPVCGSEVGGFTITGAGEDDWGVHEDKFCSECGQRIDWSNVEWSTIYRC